MYGKVTESISGLLVRVLFCLIALSTALKCLTVEKRIICNYNYKSSTKCIIDCTNFCVQNLSLPSSQGITYLCVSTIEALTFNKQLYGKAETIRRL